MDSRLELWGHVELPPTLLGDEVELRSSLRAFYGDERGDEFDRVVLTPPDRLVVDHQPLDLGDRGIELVHAGRGHTSNDLVVVVPDAGVVFAGDLLEDSAPPAYGDDSYPLDWPATAATLVGAQATTFVPGHGDVMSPAAAGEQVVAITAVADLIRELHAAGVPPGRGAGRGGRPMAVPSGRPDAGRGPGLRGPGLSKGQVAARSVPGWVSPTRP